MQLNRDTIFTAFFIIVIFLGLYFFGITYSLMGKYTKEGSKIPNKEYSIKLNNKGSIRYITPEQSEKLNNNTLIDFFHKLYQLAFDRLRQRWLSLSKPDLCKRSNVIYFLSLNISDGRISRL
ncbi:hypothetical protein [Alkanindiges illinoisensis]|uniref:Uncharacterized protein n=1 Tax=Alkanindiges illinoisensis TaxID=197183 RepID=A0A4Y7XC34_9GAMM|nr:hypothetical protein [Alkanindiges illinoisensis]TEU25630.1 hypothetical protein E2B99_09725 [Alkanindiges illinoisensis]